MSRSPLSTRQLEVLRWISDGCPDYPWPDETHKNSARALMNRGLVTVARKNKCWTAALTDDGHYFVEHGRFRQAHRPGSEPQDIDRATRAHSPEPDAAARAMRRLKNRVKSKGITQSKREIKETYMRYKVVVTRVQVAERFVRAPSEEEAVAKVQAEFDRPYGYFGSWKTTASEIEVLEAEATTPIGPTHLSNDGPLLLSIKDAAKSLGISYSAMYQLMNQGDIEWVGIGTRKYLAREAIMSFIQQHTHQGYYNPRP